MPRNDPELSPEDRRRLKSLLLGKAGSLKEFAKLMFREENPNTLAGYEQIESYAKRLYRVVNGESPLTPFTANLIARVFEIDYDELILKIRAVPTSPKMSSENSAMKRNTMAANRENRCGKS